MKRNLLRESFESKGRKKIMPDWLKFTAMGLVAVVLFGIGIWWQMAFWDECRQDHSVSYCVYLMGKK